LRTINSRLSQLVRQPRNALQALSGRPRCRVAAINPMPNSTAAVKMAGEVFVSSLEQVAAMNNPAAACVRRSIQIKGQ
jgi:hypothetical protein